MPAASAAPVAAAPVEEAPAEVPSPFHHTNERPLNHITFSRRSQKKRPFSA